MCKHRFKVKGNVDSQGKRTGHPGYVLWPSRSNSTKNNSTKEKETLREVRLAHWLSHRWK